MANEIDLDFGTLDLNSTNNIAIARIDMKENQDLKIHSIPKTDGSIAETARRSSMQVDVMGDIGGSDYDDLRTNLDTLKSGLYNGSQKFTTDDDRYMMAQLKAFNFRYEWIRTLAIWKASFVAHYPFWLAETATTDTRTPTSGVGYTLANSGNAPARCKIVMTGPTGGISNDIALSNSTTGEGLTFTGDLAEGELLEIDNRYDTDDFEVLNDGADAHVNFEGDFITLDPGNNTIVFTGSSVPEITFTWRNTWY